MEYICLVFCVQCSIAAHVVIYGQTYGCGIVLGYIGIAVYKRWLTGYAKHIIVEVFVHDARFSTRKQMYQLTMHNK